MKSLIKRFFLFSAYQLFWANFCHAQKQEFISEKNIIFVSGEKPKPPIVKFENKRISFVPVVDDESKKALLILPNEGLDGAMNLVLTKKNKVKVFGKVRTVYYDAFQQKQKCSVLVISTDRVLTSIVILLSFPNNKSIEWSFSNLRPVYFD